MNNYDVIVIGAGPAGMMAAGVASNNNKKVLLLEKNPMLGKKLRITGKGRCNITNICDADVFFENITHNSKFMYSAFYSFDNNAVIDFFQNLGLKLKTERGGRVFPDSDKAIDVVNAMTEFVGKKVTVVNNTRVNEVLIKNNKVLGVSTNDGNFYAEKVIVATGGKSYPLTGSTGDGYRFAEECGHTIITPKPSLVPVVIKEKFCAMLQGLSLKNIALKLYEDNKLIFEDFGEMLFTHFGISGPLVLSASSHILKGEYKISIDLKPALTNDVLDKRILRDFEKYANKDFINSLDDLLPRKLIPVVVDLSGIPADKKVHDITKAERLSLVNVIKNFEMKVKELRPISEAIITSGGVKVTEISPSDMQSKFVKGLYFCGEVIDVDAYTGGFNLQIAFSTGYLAGISASE